MDISVVVALVVGAVSIVLALVAIWHSWQLERKSNENYNLTKDLLSDMSQKAAVIEATVNNTQTNLVDTITEIAKPKQDSQEEMLMNALLPMLMQNPEALVRLTRLSDQQGR